MTSPIKLPELPNAQFLVLSKFGASEEKMYSEKQMITFAQSAITLNSISKLTNNLPANPWASPSTDTTTYDLQLRVIESADTAALPCSHAYFQFASDIQATAILDAFAVLIELRRQPGVEQPNNRNQFSATPADNFQKIEYFEFGDYVQQSARARLLIPLFATEYDLKHAIEVVGVERVLAMFKTMHTY